MMSMFNQSQKADILLYILSTFQLQNLEMSNAWILEKSSSNSMKH